MATPKQLSANRRNAQKSTGPRTPEGKRASSHNRLTHGIRAEDLVVDDRFERPEDFDALRDALIDEFQPATPLEELLVDQIAALHWRSRRILRAEAGAIRAAVADTLAGSVKQTVDDLDWSLQQLDMMGRDNVYDASIAATLRRRIDASAMGQDLLLRFLRSARDTLAAGNELSPAVRQRLIDFTGPTSELTRLLQQSDPIAESALLSELSALTTKPAPPGPPSPTPQSPKATTKASKPKSQGSQLTAHSSSLISHLSSLISTAEARLATLHKREAQSRARLTASLSLPPANAADRILRYDTTLGNALARALAQLRHLQSRRAQNPPLQDLSN